MHYLALILAILTSVTSSAEAQVHVRGYTRRDGTYVAPHYRSSPNHTTADNYSTRGNVNPYTGEPGTRDPEPTSRPYVYSPYPTYTVPSVASTKPIAEPVIAASDIVSTPQTDDEVDLPTPPAILTGSDVYDHCRPEASERDGITCLGYLNGINDATVAIANAGLVVKPFCFPDDMTIGELATYTADAIRRDRAQWDAGSGMAVMMVWVTGYPCTPE